MKILLATDGSSHAYEAAQFLGQLDQTGPMHVTLITVSYRPENVTSSSVAPWYPEWREGESKRVEELHRELSDLLQPMVATLETCHLHGSPAQNILDKAKEIDCDLLVLGAQGHSLLGRLLLGSVSDTVATHAHCSVLVVRPNDPEGQKLETITLAYDGSSGAENAARELLATHLHHETNLCVLRVMPTVDFYGQYYAQSYQDYDKAEYERVHAEAEKVARRLSAGTRQDELHIVRGDHAGESIVVSAEKNGSDLVVLGDTGHGPMHDLLLGNTTKYVLRHAGCSVWISRHPGVAKPRQSNETASATS